MSDSLWLVRLPEAIAQAYSQIENGGAVGVLESGEEGGPGLRIRLSPQGDVFALEELKGGPQLVAFGADDAHKAFDYKGVVTKNMAMKPLDLEKYNLLLKKRAERAAERPTTKAVGRVDSMESSIVDFVPPVSVQLKLKAEEAKQEAKRQRTSGQAGDMLQATEADIRRKIFEAFKREGTGRAALQALCAYCRSEFPILSEKEIKDELSKYAAFVRKGPNKGTWELKPDYKL